MTQYIKGITCPIKTSVNSKCPSPVDQDLPLSKEQLAVKEEKLAMMIDHLVSTNDLPIPFWS